METRANYVAVGLFVLIFVLGAVGFTLWLAKFQLDSQYRNYLLVFQSSVSGLGQGSAVRFSGVRVGEVESIDIDPDRPSDIRVVVRVDADTPVREDTTAQMVSQGLAGGRSILLTPGDPNAGPAVQQEDDPYPRIRTISSSLDQVLESAPDLVASLDDLLRRGDQLLSDQNIDAVSRMLNDGADAMANLNDATAVAADIARDLRIEITRLSDRIDSTLIAVEQAATAGQDVGVEVAEALRDLQTAADSLAQLSAQASATLEENRGPLRDFTDGGLNQLGALLVELRALVGQVDHISTEFQRDPARYFFGDPQDGYVPEDR